MQQLIAYLIEHNRYMNNLGIAVVLGIAFLFSKNKRAINVRIIGTALLLQFGIAVAVLRTNIGQAIVQTISHYVGNMYQFADAGISFVFGNLANVEGPWGFIFVVKVLPVIIFFGAFMSLLFHCGIVQVFVGMLNTIIRPLLGTSGAETLCAISNSFLGQTEAPLLVRNYLGSMTKSEFMVVMVSGMGSISGAILVVFAAMGVPITHLLAASVMGIPSTILIAKMLLPETKKAVTASGVAISFEKKKGNVLDAISQGTSDGLSLALNVAAMLISFLALLALINACLGYGSMLINYALVYLNIAYQIPELSIPFIFGYLFAPFGYLLGFTGENALTVGRLLGTKVAVNELIAYGDLMRLNLPERLVNIVTYALCGFSNFSCIGIQIGGIGALVPEKRAWLTQLGLYAVLGGALANILSAMVAGLLL